MSCWVELSWIYVRMFLWGFKHKLVLQVFLNKTHTMHFSASDIIKRNKPKSLNQVWQIGFFMVWVLEAWTFIFDSWLQNNKRGHGFLQVEVGTYGNRHRLHASDWLVFATRFRSNKQQLLYFLSHHGMSHCFNWTGFRLRGWPVGV